GSRGRLVRASADARRGVPRPRAIIPGAPRTAFRANAGAGFGVIGGWPIGVFPDRRDIDSRPASHYLGQRGQTNLTKV
ncbi:hypothetical protein ACX84Q_26950, partial [Burkholderia pseudomallei]